MITDLIQIVLLFVLPVVLLHFRVIPVKYQLSVLILVSLIILGLVIQEQWTMEDLGIRTDNFSNVTFPYTLFTIIWVGVIFVLAKYLNRKPVANWWSKSHFLFLFIPISILQEFAFRAFLMPKLTMIFAFASSILVILINSLLFSFLHIIYPNTKIILPTVFLAGLGLAGLYFYYPNLILISLVHMVLNFVAVLYQFFTFPQVENQYEEIGRVGTRVGTVLK